MLILKAARQTYSLLPVGVSRAGFFWGKPVIWHRVTVLRTTLQPCGSLKRLSTCSGAFYKQRFVALRNRTVQVSLSKSVCSMADTMRQRMVWVDLEMTGLDIEKDAIIEMACIITDSELNILAEGPNIIINQPDELLDSMSAWCKEHHGKSGLTQAVQESKVSLQQAEYEFLSFVRQHTPPGLCPLAGNSVHADKKFLDKYMPEFMRHLHYRIIDVSTIKELCREEERERD
ncbi:oligoribonuclease, mitochondrial isoform X2 [Protopterus annectens]|uniref:oligoribonuclease, mitochondrial isoform X2 n=1 Tax=Protopterus annectens TaxID=7888 RepID=UPI001CF9D97F|nr:oligoribonuclease, mitochondrial isoform X2 [Protopterus annectens]